MPTTRLQFKATNGDEEEQLQYTNIVDVDELLDSDEEDENYDDDDDASLGGRKNGWKKKKKNVTMVEVKKHRRAHARGLSNLSGFSKTPPSSTSGKAFLQRIDGKEVLKDECIFPDDATMSRIATEKFQELSLFDQKAVSKGLKDSYILVFRDRRSDEIIDVFRGYRAALKEFKFDHHHIAGIEMNERKDVNSTLVVERIHQASMLYTQALEMAAKNVALKEEVIKIEEEYRKNHKGGSESVPLIMTSISSGEVVGKARCTAGVTSALGHSVDHPFVDNVKRLRDEKKRLNVAELKNTTRNLKLGDLTILQVGESIVINGHSLKRVTLDQYDEVDTPEWITPEHQTESKKNPPTQLYVRPNYRKSKALFMVHPISKNGVASPRPCGKGTTNDVIRSWVGNYVKSDYLEDLFQFSRTAEALKHKKRKDVSKFLLAMDSRKRQKFTKLSVDDIKSKDEMKINGFLFKKVDEETFNNSELPRKKPKK